jgi:hypothetical protein
LAARAVFLLPRLLLLFLLLLLLLGRLVLIWWQQCPQAVLQLQKLLGKAVHQWLCL